MRIKPRNSLIVASRGVIIMFDDGIYYNITFAVCTYNGGKLYHGFCVCPFLNVLLTWNIQYNMSNMSIMSHMSFLWGIERAQLHIGVGFNFILFSHYRSAIMTITILLRAGVVVSAECPCKVAV